MSIIAKLYADGQVFNVLSCEHGFKQVTDPTGRPFAKPYHVGLVAKIECTKNLYFFEKAIHPTDQISEVILEYSHSFLSQRPRKIRFLDCHVTIIHTHFKAKGPNSFTETICIRAAAIEESHSAAKYSTYRQVTPFASDTTPLTITETPETVITNIAWQHPETAENNCTEIQYTQQVGLTAQIDHPSGSTATITIEKEDGTEFESGKKQLTFTETITEDGQVAIAPFEIKEAWETSKTADIDTLIARVSHNGVQRRSTALQIVPLPKVIVDFRPEKNYTGTYGFDYMRHKTQKKDHITYQDILGTNATVRNTKTGKISNRFTKYPNNTKYNDLKDNQYTTTTFPWYKDAKGNPVPYIQSWLTLYPQQKVQLSLQIDTIENPKKLPLTLEYDKTLFKLSTDTIPAQSKGKKRLHDYLTLECLQEFDTDQQIQVLHGKRPLGALMILKNSKQHRYTLDVVFVAVKTQLIQGKKPKVKTTGERLFLEKYLKQGLISPKVVEENLDLTTDTTFNSRFSGTGQGYIDNRTGLHAYLNQQMPAKYKNYLKIYFIPDKCPVLDKNGVPIARINGQAMAIGSDAVVVFLGHNKSTTTHEALHALGLRHTFDKKATYGYKKGETYNIMDYSHEPKYGRKKRILTWLWQWKALWKNNLVTPE